MTLTFIELRTLVAADELEVGFKALGLRAKITLANLDILLDEGLYDATDLVELNFGGTALVEAHDQRRLAKGCSAGDCTTA